MTIDITVAVPALDAALTVGATLESVLNQADSAVEIVVVDDGSSDCTREIVTRITDPRVRLLDGPGAGAAAARNVALREAHGSWVAFLDADDTWMPGRLAALREAISGRPDAVACFGAALHIYDDGRVAAVFRADARHATITGLLRRRLQPTTSATAVRRDVALSIDGFYEGFRARAGVEDIDLWWRLAALGPCIVQSEPLVRYAVGETRLCSRSFEDLRDLRADRALCVRRLRERVPDGLIRHAAAKHYAVLARSWLLAGHRREGTRDALRSLCWYPTPDALAILLLVPMPVGSANRLRRLRHRVLARGRR